MTTDANHLSSECEVSSPAFPSIKFGRAGAIATLIAVTPFLSALAFPTYHDPAQNGQGYCAQCHPGFTGGPSNTLHEMHTAGIDPVTGNCNLCHTGNTRNNPFTMWSTLNSGTGLGCMGCHGQDYGETIKSNYANGTATFTIAGLHKNSGYGLRRHHARKGIGLCATCHTNDVNVTPYPENVIDPGLGFTSHYYLRTDVSLGGKPVNPITNEDSANDADAVGLDNDGDFVYDANDPDADTNAPVRLTMSLTATNTAMFTWPYANDGWRLQVTSALGDTNIWTDVAAVPREPATNSTVWRILLSPVEGTKFYRINRKF